MTVSTTVATATTGLRPHRDRAGHEPAAINALGAAGGADALGGRGR